MFTTRFPCLLNPVKRTLSQYPLLRKEAWPKPTLKDVPIPMLEEDQPTVQFLKNCTWQPLASYLKKKSQAPPNTISPPNTTPPPKTISPPKLPVFEEQLVSENLLNFEEHTTRGRNPVNFSTYPPSETPSVAKIFYIPSPTSTFLPTNDVCDLLSRITSATIITPSPSIFTKPFPQSLHDLLKIYDHFKTDPTPTAILASGITASLAAAIGITEQSVSALGIWGGVLDLTVHAERAAAWDRRNRKWCLHPLPSNTENFPVVGQKDKLGITLAEFWKLRHHHFPNPETWADPFVSPQLFFRSAPVEFSRLSMKEIWGNQMLEEWGGNWMSYSQKMLEDDGDDLIYPRSQSRTLQNFPPWGREKPFPYIYLMFPATDEGKDDVTAEQGAAFAEVARSSLEQWLIMNQKQEKEDAAIAVRNRIFIEKLEADWTWKHATWNMGHWLKGVFDNIQKI